MTMVKRDVFLAQPDVAREHVVADIVHETLDVYLLAFLSCDLYTKAVQVLDPIESTPPWPVTVVSFNLRAAAIDLKREGLQ